MQKGIDVPSCPKGSDKQAWIAQVNTGKYNFERIFFSPSDFPTVAKKFNDLLSTVIPESTPEKVAEALAGCLNAYQTGLVREERFHLVAEKKAMVTNDKETLDASF